MHASYWLLLGNLIYDCLLSIVYWNSYVNLAAYSSIWKSAWNTIEMNKICWGNMPNRFKRNELNQNSALRIPNIWECWMSKVFKNCSFVYSGPFKFRLEMRCIRTALVFFCKWNFKIKRNKERMNDNNSAQHRALNLKIIYSPMWAVFFLSRFFQFIHSHTV